jgi:hypothetical protein
MFYTLKREDLIDGPWQEDLNAHPEQVYQFTHQGYNCKIKRIHQSWTYDGLVTLPESHPDYRKTADLIEDDIYIHGGITYGKAGTFGFSCNEASLCDLSPAQETLIRRFNWESSGHTHYWTREEVIEELKRLVNQFKYRQSLDASSTLDESFYT